MITIKLKLSDALEKKLDETISKNVDLTLDKLIDKTVIDLKDVTPVDTGYARSRWTSYKKEKFKISFSFKSPFFFKLTDSEHIIENDADYIQYLNAGWSKQAPPFFVEQVLIKNGFQPNVKSG